MLVAFDPIRLLVPALLELRSDSLRLSVWQPRLDRILGNDGWPPLLALYQVKSSLSDALRRVMPEPEQPPEIDIPSHEAEQAMPPALAALVEERRRAQQAAADAAVRASVVIMPPSTWREIQDRAASVGVQAALLADGGRLYLVAELPITEGTATGGS